MEETIDSHIKAIIIIGALALFASTFWLSGIPKIPVPELGGLHVLSSTLGISETQVMHMALSEKLLMVFYTISLLVIAYCLIGLSNIFFMYLKNPKLHHIKAYIRKGTYHGYSKNLITNRLKKSGWDVLTITKAISYVFPED